MYLKPLRSATTMMVLALISITSGAQTAQDNKLDSQPLEILEQGSFSAGGSCKMEPGKFMPDMPVEPAGQSYRGDHAYAFYQVPPRAMQHPIIMVHGHGQFSKTWETTPDGREGFQNLFLRSRFATILVDAPRRGDAGRSMIAADLEPTAQDQIWFDVFRVGKWPNYFENVQFAKDPTTLNNYFRQMTPNFGDFDVEVSSDGISAVVAESTRRWHESPILFTHSQGGGIGWLTFLKNPQIAAIVAFEPANNFPFPEGLVPPTPFMDPPLTRTVSMDTFMQLTQVPIIIFYGDNIPTQKDPDPILDTWRIRVDLASQWVNLINKKHGHASLIKLPDKGIHGNTHFPFSDLNNQDIAKQVMKFLLPHQLVKPAGPGHTMNIYSNGATDGDLAIFDCP